MHRSNCNLESIGMQDKTPVRAKAAAFSWEDPFLLEDQLSAPLVTVDGSVIGGTPSLKYDDKSLWGNNVS